MGELLHILQGRLDKARHSLADCQWCEHRCRVNRLSGNAGRCGLASRSFSYKSFLNFAEPLELLPAHMLYFSGCNLRCRHCIQAPTAFNASAGRPMGGLELAEEFRQATVGEAGTIGLVGGEPSLHLHTIIEAALTCQAAGVTVAPLALHTNMYMTPFVLEMLEGLMAWYVVDFKYGNDDCARRIAGAGRYMEVLTRNLMLAKGQAKLLVRHLLLPGHVECCLAPIAQWLAANLPGVGLQLVESYVPGWSSRDELARTASAAEVLAARELVAGLGLNSTVSEAAGRISQARGGQLAEFNVTIGPDGRVFLHDLPGELLQAACEAFPDDEVLRRRLEATRARKGHQ